jgi:hypothetical protein
LTLDERKLVKKSADKKVKTSHFETLENGIYYKRGTPDAKVWPWPIFVGRVVVPGLGPDPLRTEFAREGKQFKFVFYDEKRGMIGKINIPRLHVKYILKELISKVAGIPIRGKVDINRIGTILYLDQAKLNAIEKDAENTEQSSKEVYI